MVYQEKNEGWELNYSGIIYKNAITEAENRIENDKVYLKTNGYFRSDFKTYYFSPMGLYISWHNKMYFIKQIDYIIAN